MSHVVYTVHVHAGESASATLGSMEGMEMATRFKDKNLQKMYEHLLANPPHCIDAGSGREVRKVGASLFSFFWRGFDGNGRPVPRTFAHAAYRAGRDYRANGGRDYDKVRP